MYNRTTSSIDLFTFQHLAQIMESISHKMRNHVDQLLFPPVDLTDQGMRKVLSTIAYSMKCTTLFDSYCNAVSDARYWKDGLSSYLN